MALKRKSAPTTHEEPKSKAIKVKAGSDKASGSPVKSNASKAQVPEESSEEEEINKSEGSDAEEVENDSDTLDNISDEEDEEDALDDEDEDDEDAMDIDNVTQKSKTKSDNSEITVKETPAHAAQRALAKERKLSRPNGTPISHPINISKQTSRGKENLGIATPSKTIQS
jgi:hypothetical protein